MPVMSRFLLPQTGAQRPLCTCSIGGRPGHTQPAFRRNDTVGLSQICPPAHQRIVQQASSSRRGRLVVTAASDHNPPPVSDTKARFYESFRKPMNPIYNTVIQELLVQQHVMRFNKKYSYDEVFALGFVSVFDQVLDGLPSDKEQVFSAYVKALQEDPAKYREDAKKLEQWASGLSNPTDLHPSGEGDEIRQRLAAIAQSAKDGKFLYTRFFAIGLFRLLELTKAKDPKALENLVKAMNIAPENVNRDLMTYKGVLSKLSAAKELMQEYITRERQKQKERADAKAAAASSDDKAKEPAGKETAKA